VDPEPNGLWAAILGPRGIRVNAVAPGVIDTDMSNFTKTEAGREVTLGMQALKRIGKPEDVADVVVFLASDAAPPDNGSEYPGRRWVEALRIRVLPASAGIASMRRGGTANGKNGSGE
jgi:NAD(P)-dependent dehydrogenase (short-subunit alcohol dehydrogenase family)